MHRHQFVESGSWRTPPGAPLSAQYIGRMYSVASLSKRLRPSRVSSIQVSVGTSGLSRKLAAEVFTRVQCRSRSGATPSKARPPSNTIEPSQVACVRAPMIGRLSSCQSFSKNVEVFDHWAGLGAGMVAAVGPSLSVFARVSIDRAPSVGAWRLHDTRCAGTGVATRRARRGGICRPRLLDLCDHRCDSQFA